MANRLSIVQGDTVVLQIAIKNSDDTPANLAGFDITFTIKRSRYDSDQAAVFQGTLADGDIAIVGSDEDGIIDVTVPAENSVLIRPGKPFYWDVQLTDIDDKTYTPCAGTLYSDREVTQNV
jgi:hypothetical protein